MDILDRLEFVEAAKCWVLKHDNGITPYVKERGRLNWDDAYNALVCWREVNAGDLCVDIGAYIGDTCVPMLERGARVVAVECQPDAFECLTRNLPCVEAYRCAIGEGEEVALHGGVGGNTGGRCIQKGSGTTTVSADSIIAGRSPKLVKIDVEGYECHVLRSMRLTLDRCRPIILIERNDPAICAQGGSWDEALSLLPWYRLEEWQHTGAELWDYIAWPR